MPFHVSKAQFSRLVEQALLEMPEEFARFLEEVPVEVMDRPTHEQLRTAGVGPNGLLLGLYHGRPRTVRNIEDSGALPDIIYIFQQPIEAVCRSEEELIRQVRVTVLHEVGHHFGLSEEDLERLGYR